MKDGPARRTRSATTSTERNGAGQAAIFSSVFNQLNSGSDSDGFKTPNNSPTKVKKSARKKGRTPSGQVLTNSVKDIRDFFSQNSSKVVPFIQDKLTDSWNKII